MVKNKVLAAVLLFGCMTASAQVMSPNGKLALTVAGSELTVSYEQQPVLTFQVGMDTAPLGTNLTFVQKVKADYQMLSGKQLHCTNEANEYRMGSLVMRLYNDGIAFRYELKGLQDATLPKELTAYRIPEGTKRWIQQWTDAYEGFFPLTTSYKTQPVRSFSGTFKSAEGWNVRWGYPALLEPREGVFALISEANIERRQSASCHRWSEGYCGVDLGDGCQRAFTIERYGLDSSGCCLMGVLGL